MSYPRSVFIFDIDGVLVEPLGYRAATLATLKHFIERMGLEASLAPDLESIEWFEAMHITSEWDMVPISLAILLESLLAANPDLCLPEKLDELFCLNPKTPAGRIDYRSPLEYLSTCLQPQEYPAATALRLSSAHNAEDGVQKPGFFPLLSSHTLLAEILSHSRDPYRSPTTRVFQHFSLGSRVFEQVYGIPADLETPSLLAECDQAQLPLQVQRDLQERISCGQLAAAVMTNRPSFPPREVSQTLLGYPPEAEMALTLNGLNGTPLISFGRIRYLAKTKGLEPEALLKPSPVPAVAAVLAALTGRELPCLESALELIETQNGQPLSGGDSLSRCGIDLVQVPPEGINIHIFEDTRWGIEATRQAGVLLAQAGLENTVTAWGIAKGEVKVGNLIQVGARVFATTTEVVQTAAALI